MVAETSTPPYGCPAMIGEPVSMCALAGLAGFMVVPLTLAEPQMGTVLGLKAFAIAIIAGLAGPVDGSRFPTGIFKVPIYRRPPDLVPPLNATGPGFPNRGQSLRWQSAPWFSLNVVGHRFDSLLIRPRRPQRAPAHRGCAESCRQTLQQACRPRPRLNAVAMPRRGN
jgi:hypothetical protein